MNTLHSSYYEKLVRSAKNSFADMVISDEMVENAMKSSKLDDRKKKKATHERKKMRNPNVFLRSQSNKCLLELSTILSLHYQHGLNYLFL